MKVWNLWEKRWYQLQRGSEMVQTPSTGMCARNGFKIGAVMFKID